jgi:hypothetical protein
MRVVKRIWSRQNNVGMKVIQRAQEQIEAGKLWRAKDILRGSLSNYPFSPELYQAYGELLLRMGDLRDAGKFLFLSGKREPTYENSISIFLSQFPDVKKEQFYSAFPARARLSKLSDYPVVVAEELKKRGYSEIIQHPAAPPRKETTWQKFLGGGVGVLFLLIVVLVIIGAVQFLFSGLGQIVRWIKTM